MDDYPSWVCGICGEKYGKVSMAKRGGIATWHEDECGICGDFTACTEPRDFGHLRKGWRQARAYYRRRREHGHLA
ncbi:MAG: hypothetical protein ABSF14_20240 [Terriglobia bacterium]|jgi:hypothetical protein